MCQPCVPYMCDAKLHAAVRWHTYTTLVWFTCPYNTGLIQKHYIIEIQHHTCVTPSSMQQFVGTHTQHWSDSHAHTTLGWYRNTLSLKYSTMAWPGDVAQLCCWSRNNVIKSMTQIYTYPLQRAHTDGHDSYISLHSAHELSSFFF